LRKKTNSQNWQAEERRVAAEICRRGLEHTIKNNGGSIQHMPISTHKPFNAPGILGENLDITGTDLLVVRLDGIPSEAKAEAL